MRSETNLGTLSLFLSVHIAAPTRDQADLQHVEGVRIMTFLFDSVVSEHTKNH